MKTWTPAALAVILLAILAGAARAQAPAATPASELEPDDAGAAVHRIELPEPWGPHRPAVRTLVIVDSTRPDTISPDPDDFRPILVRLWYPSDDRTAPSKPYMAPRVAAAWRSTLPAPEGFETGVITHTGVDLAVSGDRASWPVLLFSPGRSFPVENYQIALEHLASQGWIVAAISPAYEEALTLLPDGRALPFSGPSWDSEEQRGPVLMGVVDDMVLDASLVLDWLEQLNASPADPFHDRLDLERGVGYLGHSLGGAAAVWTLQRDARVQAAASWEGQVYRDEDRPLEVTGGDLLYIIGGANRTELVGTQFRPAAESVTVHEMVIDGAWHASFGELIHIYRRYADRAWLERHRREVFADRVNQITNDYVHEFFAHALLDRPLDLLWPDSIEQMGSPQQWNYPEVELRTYAF